MLLQHRQRAHALAGAHLVDGQEYGARVDDHRAFGAHARERARVAEQRSAAQVSATVPDIADATLAQHFGETLDAMQQLLAGLARERPDKEPQLGPGVFRRLLELVELVESKGEAPRVRGLPGDLLRGC